MRTTSLRLEPEAISDGVSERLFTLGAITGVFWAPAGAATPRPLVLLGHSGGSGHKRHPSLVARARRYVADCGFAVAAIDASGFGDRPKSGRDEQFIAGIEGRAAAGEPIGLQVARYATVLAADAVPEWQATLDALAELDSVGPGSPVGYWGLSLGSALGMPLAAAEPRIRAAVFGLVGYETLADVAARISIPVEFVLQWDDEIVPRDEGLALFGAFGSREKTLHANRGRHTSVPAFELESSERFFARHLCPA